MGKCKEAMNKLVTGEVEEVYILSEFEGIDNISRSIQLWRYDKQNDVISYCTITKNNKNNPYFIKIKNGVNFVNKKYVGESPTNEAKVYLITKEYAHEILK